MSNVEVTNGETGKTPPPAATAQMPAVDPGAVQENYSGQAFREVFVRMPSGLIGDDIRTPSVWKKVQASPRASLKKFDRVICVGHGEDWIVEARVIAADAQGATLMPLHVKAMPGPDTNLPADDRYYSRWGGAFFELVRRRDEVVVAKAATTQLLWRELSAQYPRPV